MTDPVLINLGFWFHQAQNLSYRLEMRFSARPIVSIRSRSKRTFVAMPIVVFLGELWSPPGDFEIGA